MDGPSRRRLSSPFPRLSTASPAACWRLRSPQNILQTNYNAFVNNAGPYAVRLILGRFTSLKEQGIDEEKIAALISADTDDGPVAASIIELWLLGSWYALGQQNVSVVVSSNPCQWLDLADPAGPSVGYSMMEFGYGRPAPAAQRIRHSAFTVLTGAAPMQPNSSAAAPCTDGRTHDVVIVGAGVPGGTIAMELLRRMCKD